MVADEELSPAGEGNGCGFREGDVLADESCPEEVVVGVRFESAAGGGDLDESRGLKVD